MRDLRQFYQPVTAYPFMKKEGYMEYRPSRALQPYISCFWYSEESGTATREHHVIPDTCMDIIITIDPEEREMANSFHSLNDTPFISNRAGEKKNIGAIFGIRFYFWTVHLFMNDSLKNTVNAVLPVEQYFENWSWCFEKRLDRRQGIAGWIRTAEKFLAEQFQGAHENDYVLNTTYKILEGGGKYAVKDLAAYAAVSQRHMERIFQEHVGMSIKKVSNLVRYQNVWQDYMLHGVRDVHQMVEKYGYTDQAHLMNSFRKFHGCTLRQAGVRALEQEGMSVLYNTKKENHANLII